VPSLPVGGAWMPRKGGLISPLHEGGFQKLTRNSGSSYFISIPAIWVHSKVFPIIEGEFWVRVELSKDQSSLIITGPTEENLPFLKACLEVQHD